MTALTTRRHFNCRIASASASLMPRHPRAAPRDPPIGGGGVKNFWDNRTTYSTD